jgi:23S rRNA pseudouridine1911/1915/1917 synthase
MREVKVPTGTSPGRLDVYLAAEFGISRTQVQRLFKQDKVTIDGQPVRANVTVEAGQTIRVEELDAAVIAPIVPPDLPIVYEDDDMMVVDKPAGIAVHAGNGRPGEPTVADFARLHTTDPDPDRPGIVHRLDRETSGLLVLAKTEAAKLALQKQWKDRHVHKTYQLLAVGRVEPDEAVIKLPLDRDQARPTQRRVSAAGKPAVTHYKVQAHYAGYTYVEAYPETGRTHQLRVHFAAMGHPIAADVVYGTKLRPLGLRRHFLHACRLELTTPSGQKLDLRSPLPAELQAALDQLG